MSFQPVITLEAVPRSSDSFSTIDATPTGGSNGYGSTNAPASANDLTVAWGSMQPYAGEPVPATGVAGSVATQLDFNLNIPDGVDTFHVYYGMQQSITFNIANNRMSITSSDVNLLNKLDGVIAIQLDTNFPVLIKNIVGNTVNLISPLPGALTTGTALYKYWHGQVQALILNQGEGSIVNSIAKLPVVSNPCGGNSQKILDSILLKIGATIAFDAGNYAKAHEAARLLSNNKPISSTNCVTCE